MGWATPTPQGEVDEGAPRRSSTSFDFEEAERFLAAADDG
jgi:hypothetical protein